MRTKNVGLLGLAVLTCVACGKGSGSGESVPTVKIATIETVNESATLQYPGRVRAAQDVSLSFRVSGVLDRILVKEGARVSKGQLLATLDPTDYKVQLTATEAEYKQVKAEAERVIALYNDSGTTANAYDKATYGLKQIEAKYQHAQDELAYTHLYAPFSGSVQKRLFDANETVGAGTPILTIISNDAPEVEINLPAADYIRRAEFGTYSCTFDIYPDEVYPLQLISIAPQANANQLYTMRLQLVVGERPHPSPGMNTMVTIHCNGEGPATYSVPTTALKQTDDRSQLFLFNAKDSTVHALDVTVVKLQSDGQSLVSGAALKAGDKIVTSGIHYVRDGAKVKTMPAASKTNVGGLL